MMLWISACAFLIHFAFNLAVIAQTRTSSTASLNIVENQIDLQLGPFTISPKQINIGENLIFTLSNILIQDGSFGSNLVCRIYITSPDQSLSVIQGFTTSQGECKYNISQSLESQGLTLLSGDLFTINNSLGEGSGYVEVDYFGNTFRSNIDTYTVQRPITISPLIFKINPNSITQGDPITFALIDVKFSNNEAATNLICRLRLTSPGNQSVVIRGVTDSNGSCVYNRERIQLSSQNIAVYAQTPGTNGIVVESGDVTTLNNIIGSGSGYGEIEYDGQIFTSNVDTYTVNSRPLPIIEPVIRVIETIRTGGTGTYIILSLVGIIFALGMIMSYSKKRGFNKKR